MINARSRYVMISAIFLILLGIASGCQLSLNMWYEGDTILTTQDDSKADCEWEVV